MGGSGGRGYSGSSDSATLADQARKELERQEFIAEVNDYLGELLKGFNARDAEECPTTMGWPSAVLTAATTQAT